MERCASSHGRRTLVFAYARENEFRRVGTRNLQGISCAQELPRSEFFSLGFGKRPDASASRTCILALSKRDLAAPTVMPKTHAVSAVLRFLTSRRKSTSRYFRERASIPRCSVSPNFFLRSASQAISRHSVKSFAIFPDRDLRPSVCLVASAAKTFSKLAAVTGSVFVLMPVMMSRAAKSSTRKVDLTNQLSGSDGGARV